MKKEPVSLLILYPWGIDTVIQKNNGAGLRVGLLADFLRDHGFLVTVMSTGRRECLIRKDSIHYREVSLTSSVLGFLSYGATILISRLLHWPAIQAVLNYVTPSLDKRFLRKLRSAAEDSDVILLEYPFWFTAIGPTASRTILTNHDVLALSWTRSGPTLLNKPFFASLLRREIAAMNNSAKAVAVASQDAAYFQNCGVREVSVITNPVELPVNISPSACLEVPLENFTESRLSCGALFIGSGWYPNRSAAKTLVEKIAPACPEIAFFIVGNCTKSLATFLPNVFFLNSISGENLAALYRFSTYALIPVAWGTGTSLKAVEAMAYGKVILSTKIGVRGLPFEDNVHGVICEDITEYPSLIHELQGDPVRRQNLAKNARQLAENYDYRTIFMPYLEMIDELIAERK